MRPWSFLMGALLFASCVNHTVDIEQYDRTCEVDEDCVLAGSGDACLCLDCEGAINADAYTLYAADVSAASEGCTVQADCAACEPRRAVCTDGTCTSELSNE